MEQEKVLSYALSLVRDKFAGWFPGVAVFIFDGKIREGLALVVTGLEGDGLNNPMEILRVLAAGGGEIQVSAPRMVSLRLAAVACFGDTLEALDGAARLKRNLHDDPFIRLEECLWHGCSEPRVALEFCESGRPLPGELREFESCRWDLSLRLGINSAREEKVVKVRERQFTAVGK